MEDVRHYEASQQAEANERLGSKSGPTSPTTPSAPASASSGVVGGASAIASPSAAGEDAEITNLEDQLSATGVSSD